MIAIRLEHAAAVFSLRARRRRAFFPPVDAKLEEPTPYARRCRNVRLLLHARRPKAARSVAAINGRASSGIGGRAKIDIGNSIRPRDGFAAANNPHRQKHGWSDRLPYRAGGERRRPRLSRVPAVRDGGSNETAR